MFIERRNKVNDIINQFQKDAKKVGRDENSIEELKIWVEAKEKNKKGFSSDDDVVLKAISVGDISETDLFEAIYESDAQSLLDDNPYILENLITAVVDEGNYLEKVVDWAKENMPKLFKEGGED